MNSLSSTLVRDLFARFFDQRFRAIRLRFAEPSSKLFEGALLPQRVEVTEGLCEGITAHLTCLTTRSDLPLPLLLGLPIEVQFVTDVGDTKRLCVIVTQVRQGQSDGTVTCLQLTGQDVFAVMDKRRSNRVFLNKCLPGILRTVLDGWRMRFPALGKCFDYTLRGIDESRYPKRAFTMQAHQTDAAFLRSLLSRDGLSWFFRPGQHNDGAIAVQELVIFDDAYHLPENGAGPIKYHRRDGTEPRDTVNLLAPTLRLVSGAVHLSSWDHESARVNSAADSSAVDQGESGNQWAAALQEARIVLPHAGDDASDLRRLARITQQRHEAQAHTLHGVGGVRAQAVGEYNRIDGHPRLGDLPSEREYITTRLTHWAENNLPKELNHRAQALLAASQASVAGWVASSRAADEGFADAVADGEQRYTNRFVAVRRDAPITPAWNPQDDLPTMHLMTATVVSADGHPVWCDELGRVKVQFHGLDPADHEHAGGAGTNGNAGDSAWVRVNWLWCGEGFGVVFPLRPGMEVSIGFEMGDPSRPMIVGSRYNAENPPPRFDRLGALPDNAALSGIVTRELNGGRQQQLRFNDTTGNISVQLGSDHAASQLNLGSLATPMNRGKTRPRGEGAELRSDAATAIRGAQGVLVSAAPRLNADGGQLDRAELVGLVQSLQSIVQSLGELAQAHEAGLTDPKRVQQLVKHLQDWENGFNTARGESGGGAPVVAVTAPAGTAVTSQDNLLLGAQTNVDVVSVGHTQLLAGKQIRQRAQSGLSLFAADGGLDAVAGKGLVDVQAHQGDIHLTASGTIMLTAGAKVVIQAPEVEVISKGAATRWGGGTIVEQAKGPFVVKAASFAQSSGGDGVPAGVKLPASGSPFDQQVTLCAFDTDEPLPNQRYRITTETGRVTVGTTDANGLTQRFKLSEPYENYSIELIQG